MIIRLTHVFHQHSWQKIAEGCHVAVHGALERCECRPAKFAYRFLPHAKELQPMVAEAQDA